VKLSALCEHRFFAFKNLTHANFQPLQLIQPNLIFTAE
jgi:hypothetical protein